MGDELVKTGEQLLQEVWLEKEKKKDSNRFFQNDTQVWTRSNAERKQPVKKEEASGEQNHWVRTSQPERCANPGSWWGIQFGVSEAKKGGCEYR